MSEDHDPQLPADCCGDAAVYLLSLLDERQGSAFLEHARSCSVCSDELEALAPAMDRLPATVPQLPAPEHVKRRVMAVVRAEAASHAVHSHSRPDSERSRFAERLDREQLGSRFGGVRKRLGWRADRAHRRFELRGPALALTAAGLLAAGVAVGALSTPFGGATARDGGTSTQAVSADVTLAGAHATLHQSGGRMWLTVTRMPAPSSGHVYEVWVKYPGRALPQPTDSLFTPTASGAGTVAVPGAAGASVVMVTQEPAGGSPLPTTTPVIVAHVS